MVRYTLIFMIALSSLKCFSQDKVYKDLSVPAFKSKLDSLSGEVLLDLRTPDELKNGVIPGATYLDYFRLDFEKEVTKLDKDKIYFVYCASGVRSAETMELMSKHGFKGVYNLKDGFMAWKKRKMPVESFKK